MAEWNRNKKKNNNEKRSKTVSLLASLCDELRMTDGQWNTGIDDNSLLWGNVDGISLLEKNMIEVL